jgi:hypothetical protein
MLLMAFSTSGRLDLHATRLFLCLVALHCQQMTEIVIKRIRLTMTRGNRASFEDNVLPILLLVSTSPFAKYLQEKRREIARNRAEQKQARSTGKNSKQFIHCL